MSIHIDINIPTDVDFKDDIWVTINVGDTPFTTIEEEFTIDCDKEECEHPLCNCVKNIKVTSMSIGEELEDFDEKLEESIDN